MGNAFDGNGNPTRYCGNACAYDPEDRQTADGGQTNTYTGDGLRAEKVWGGTTAYFLYDGDTMLAETDGGGAVTALNTWGADGLASRRSGGADSFYCWDPSGNGAERLTSTGAVMNSLAVDGFGEQRAAGPVGDPYSGFGGRWGGYTDAGTGLTLLGHRLFNFFSGRFLTRDPIGYDGGVNLYAYTRNNPVNRRDSLGLWSITFGGSLTGVIGLPIGVGGSISGGIIIGDGGFGVFGTVVGGVGVGVVASAGLSGGYSGAPQPAGFQGGPIYGGGGTIDFGGGGSVSVTNPLPGSNGPGGISGWKGGPSWGGGIGGYAGPGWGGTAMIPWPNPTQGMPGFPGGPSLPPSPGTPPGGGSSGGPGYDPGNCSLMF